MQENTMGKLKRKTKAETTAGESSVEFWLFQNMFVEMLFYLSVKHLDYKFQQFILEQNKKEKQEKPSQVFTWTNKGKERLCAKENAT